MGAFIEEKKFIDYGNTPECRVEDIGAWEYLPNGMVCIYAVKQSHGEWVQDHATVMSIAAVKTIAAKLLQIAAGADSPLVVLASDLAKLAS